MAKGVFTTQIYSKYNDLPEYRYHFPKMYLSRVQKTLDDWIIYYEPSRNDPAGTERTGRLSYFATAHVNEIKEDPDNPDHYYVYIDNYLELTSDVPFKFGTTFLERKLGRPDGRTNTGMFQNAVRIITDNEFQAILNLGLTEVPVLNETVNNHLMIADPPADYERPIVTTLTERPLRDAAFAKNVKEAYASKCAFTGICIINGGGKAEVDAAHIKPVSESGPDSTRNGIALSKTVHWMFDRGLLSLEDNGKILMAKKQIPDQVERIINPSGEVHLPENTLYRPHPQFLRYHRENKFLG
jgi:putative restriction endonuclease